MARKPGPPKCGNAGKGGGGGVHVGGRGTCRRPEILKKTGDTRWRRRDAMAMASCIRLVPGRERSIPGRERSVPGREGLICVFEGSICTGVCAGFQFFPE